MSYVEAGLEYAQQVLSGATPACKWVKYTCQRQIADLARQDTEDFPYYFDDDAANEVCEYIENLPHVYGKWAVKKPGDPTAHLIRLEPWQCFNITTQFGWKREDGKRRFREVFMLEPRKNAKSTIEAAIGNYMTSADGEEGAQVYCGATTQAQAMMVFKPAWLMVSRDAEMREYLGLGVTGTIENPKGAYQNHSGSSFVPLIGKPGDGANPHCAIVDEYHEHADDGMVAAMRLGMGSREQPMLRIISTAGDDISGPCYQKQLEIQQILEGLVSAEDVYGIIYTIDDDDPWDTIESAIKANPNYGVSIQPENVLSELEEAKRNPAKQSAYKTKRLNIWVGSRSPFFNLEAWIALGDPSLKEEDFAGEECWLATDAATKLDLSSSIKLFRRTINSKEHYYMFARHYLPEDRIYSPDNPNKQYIAWTSNDWIIATGENATDFSIVESDILKDCLKFKVRNWAYDPMYLTQVSQRLEAAGVTVVEVRQVPMNHSNPMKEWQALIEDGRIHHNGDPVLAWAVGNCTARYDANDNVYPRKERNELKIDPVVAGIMALGRAILETGSGRSVYETRGIDYL